MQLKAYIGGHIETPLGKLTALLDATGRLTHLAFPEEVESDRWRIPSGAIIWSQGAVADITRQIDAYFAGKRRHFDLDLAPIGTPFQQEVWSSLRRIPYGTTSTYGRMAAELDRPSAARAVGAANGANPISLIIPCHRLISSTGALIKYAGGLAVKRGLLEFEGALPRSASSV
jgi:methylated-DNA-[protein]-cysteine S-methyltransferase